MVSSTIEILTRDSNKPGLTKPITRSDRTQFIQTHGTKNMTHSIKSNRTIVFISRKWKPEN